MKDVLSFDLTGTLATFSYCDAVWFEGLPELYAEKYNVPVDKAKEYLTEQYKMVGDQAPEWYDIKYWFGRFRLGNGWGKLLEQFSPRIEFYPEAKSTLQQCSQKYDLVLITNAARVLLRSRREP